MMEIPKNECDFVASVDLVGRVFQFEGRVLRGIYPEYVEHVLHILALAEERRWFDHGLIPTWKTDFRVEGFPLVLEHRRIPCVTYRAEWPGETLRHAAVTYLGLCETLSESGFCLTDSHTWNVLIESTTPHFVDWGSIRPTHELNWHAWYAELRQYFLIPLYLFSVGEPRLARAALREHRIGVAVELMDRPVFQTLPEEPRRIVQNQAQLSPTAVFRALADWVAALALPRVEGEWVGYDQPPFRGLADLESVRLKDRVVHDLMASDPARTVLDIGCNYGLHSQMCAAMGKRVVSLDIEETCLNDLYLRAKRTGQDILPLYVDFLWPLPESGLMNTFPPARQRLASDTVLAMALVHHLVFKHFLSFETIASSIAGFSRSRAIVEFVPAEDVHVAQWSPERIPWYRLENFVDAMRRHFRGVESVASEPFPRRILVFTK
jgi:hypothetical protein